MQSKIEQIIRKQLKASRKRCAFKRALLAKGWVCVNINECAKCLTKEIEDELQQKR